MAMPSLDSLIPHRGEMSLLDEVVALSAQETTCRVTIGSNDPFFETRGVPAYVGLEYMAQSIAAHGGNENKAKGLPVQIGFLLGTRHFETHVQFFEPGMVLKVVVHPIWGEDELMNFQCRIYEEKTDRLLQDAQVNVFRPKQVQAYLEGGQT